MGRERVAWVDVAKGLCIVMVVMMHSTLGVEKAFGAEGWLHPLVAFARPFRMPDFFLISGLFLGRVVDRPWPDYLDRKVVHFAWSYVLWLLIQGALKWPALALDEGLPAVAQVFLLSFVEPLGTLWFIYLLPVFFVATKLLRPLPALLVWAAAAGLEMLPIETGWTVVDEFAARYVYFLTGFRAAPLVFEFAERVAGRPRVALAALLGWAFLNGAAVAAEVATIPGIGLALGFLGAAAIVALASLLERSGIAAPLRALGARSIVVYLAFFLPMAATRAVLLRLGLIEDIGTISALVTTAGVIGPLVLHRAVMGTPLRFLFERPAWARLAPARPQAVAAAE